jgi:hypothetical protein
MTTTRSTSISGTGANRRHRHLRVRQLGHVRARTLAVVQAEQTGVRCRELPDVAIDCEAGNRLILPATSAAEKPTMKR